MYYGDTYKDFGDFAKQEYSPKDILGMAKAGNLRGYGAYTPGDMDLLDKVISQSASLDGTDKIPGANISLVDKVIKQSANAFEGFDAFADAMNPEVTAAVKSEIKKSVEVPDNTKWKAELDKASNGFTRTEIVNHLQQMINLIPDSMPASERVNLYNSVMAMLGKKNLDPKPIELASNIGWLVTPNIIPRTGGFGKALNQQMSVYGAEIAQSSKAAAYNNKLFAIGRSLKDTLGLRGFSGLGEFDHKKMIVVLLVACAAIATFMYFKNKRAVSFRKKK